MRIQPRIYVLLDQMVYSGGSFGLTIVLAKYYDLEVFGLFGSLMLVGYLLSNLIGAVVVQPFQVTYARVGALPAYLRFVVQSQMVLTLTAVLLGTAIVQLPAIQAAGWRAPMFMWVGGFLLHDALRKVLLAIGKVQIAFIADLINALLQGVVLIGMWINDWNLLDLTLILGLAYLPALTYGGLRLGLLRMPASVRLRWRAYLRIHIRDGRWLLLTAMVQWWSSNLFVVASGLFLGKSVLGAFRLVQSMFGVLNILLQALENYGLPQAARLHVKNPQQAKAFLQRLGLYGMLVFGVVLSALSLKAAPLLEWVAGSDFVQYAYVVRGMAILYALIAVSYPVRIAIRMMVLNRAFFMGYLFSFIFSITSCYFLLHAAGMTGCLIGLIVNQLIMLVCWQYVLHKKQYFLWKSSTSF